jgi:FlgD Ig-like domain/Bacterial Ig domain
MSYRPITTLLTILSLVILVSTATARNPIRRTFFSLYPVADNTQLSDLPSNGSHCGACHYDFDGGGTRNAYGLAVEVGIQAGLSNEEAILTVEDNDSDGDGFTNLQEITDIDGFSNTPTFPGLATAHLPSVINVDPAEVSPHLTPAGSTDTTPPVVTVHSPNGGETLLPNTVFTVTWTATDNVGVASVEIYLSDDSGASRKPLLKGLLNDGTQDVFLPILPGTNNRIIVEAYDPSGNAGEDMSNGDLTIAAWTQGTAPTTLRDFELAGTQPFDGGILDNPNDVCRSCHGDFNPDSEPWFNWSGSMMGNTMVDPVFIATMIIAEQDAPSSGDLCLRCHTPGGWQEGRSLDTLGGLLTEKDRWGVHCDYCHRAVDPIYQAGVSPPVDEEILDNLHDIPLGYGNGQFVTDPDPIMRGPHPDAQPDHAFYDSDFHRRSDICGTCHDVSNPAFAYGGSPGLYVVDPLDTPHVDGDKRNMFPVERTFSEWTVSAYATSGVYAPEFAGEKPDGIVGTCQDCHMADVSGRGADGGPTRGDLGLHDFTGGNHFVPDIIGDFFPGFPDQAALTAGKARVTAMLQKAASLEVTSDNQDGQLGINVRVINETGHKLPSGYPEGRRIFINVKAYNAQAALVYESAAYDFETGTLGHDEDAKIYHIEPGTSHRLADILGIEAGVSFHFVLNDTVFLDNRIPPRGFTNANFETVQSPPVAYPYEDGQYWDDTHYTLPSGAASVEVTLYYQSISKEYVEFLRDENITDNYGQQLYDAWVAQGMAPPQLMETANLTLDLSPVDSVPTYVTGLNAALPNPFNPITKLKYSMASDGHASLKVYDSRGRTVRTLVNGIETRGEHEVVWDGRDGTGRRMASGVYMAIFEAGQVRNTKKMTLVK